MHVFIQPLLFKKLLVKNKTQSQYKVNSTGTIRYSIFLFKSKKAHFSIKYLGPKFWNSFPLELRHLPLKKFITNIEIYTRSNFSDC